MTEATRIKKELARSLKDKYPWVTRKDVTCKLTDHGTHVVNLRRDARIVNHDLTVQLHLVKVGYECMSRHHRDSVSFTKWDAEVFPRSAK